MKVLRILLLQEFLLLGVLRLLAMPAYPKAVPVQVADGVVYIRLYGDEKSKRVETTDGYTVMQRAGAWYYAEKDSLGYLKPSSHLLSAFPNTATRQFLKSMPRHLAANANLRKRKQLGHAERRHRVPKVVGSRKALVILMQYSDLPMKKSRSDFHDLFNQVGYTTDGAQGSVYDYYSDVSYGQLQLTCDVVGPFTAQYAKSYYGGNDRSGDDTRPEELFEEAVQQASSIVSLSDYDADGDGFVDNVHIIFAGYGEEAGAEQDAIWSHEATFYAPYEVQGMKIDRYSCAPELRGKSGTGISRIGPHCHEIGHALGAMDYYDTDYEAGGEYEGTGDWDVMAGGSWNNDGITPADFNPYVKAFDFGWITPAALPLGEVLLPPSSDDAESYYMLRSPESDDFYLLENRSKDKWGAGVPGEGLLLFHVHPDVANVGNGINATAPQMCYLVCASSQYRKPGSSRMSYGDINSDGCPYPGTSGNRTFGENSTPSAFFWSGEECGIDISGISRESDGTIRLVNNSVGVLGRPTSVTSLFFEGFEADTSIRVRESSGRTWQIVENPSSMKNIGRLLAYEGRRCMQLSAKNFAGDANSTFEIRLPSITAKGLLRMKFHMASLAAQTSTPNRLRVGYQTADNSAWQFVDFSSSENGLWRQHSVALPENVLPTILIEGTVSAGSTLAVDNIKVEQEAGDEETEIRAVPCGGGIGNDGGIYTLTGVRVSPAVLRSRPGIYIQNGRKIMVH